MSSDDKVPGIHKNGPQPVPDLPGIDEYAEDFDFLALDDEQQRALIDTELTRWRLQGMNVGNVPHNIFNMDAMLIALVRALNKELGISEDTLNRHYRHVTYEKLSDIRKDAMKSKVIKP